MQTRFPFRYMHVGMDWYMKRGLFIYEKHAVMERGYIRSQYTDQHPWPCTTNLPRGFRYCYLLFLSAAYYFSFISYLPRRHIFITPLRP